MKALVGAFNQEKALVGAFSVIVKTYCETDGSFYSTSVDQSQLTLTVDQGDHIPSTLMAALTPGARLAASSSKGGSSITGAPGVTRLGENSAYTLIL